MCLLGNELLGKHKYVYDTNMCLDDCVNRILSSPKTFGENVLNQENYDCILHSNNQITVVFKGAAFGKVRKTEYLLSLSRTDHHTIIHVEFMRELLGLPPMTPIQLVDTFMYQKVCGCRRV